MGSFNYSDDCSSFDNLLERYNYLAEARVSRIGGAHPSFPGLAGRLKKEVGKGFPRDVRMFIAEVLYNLDIFTDEDMDHLRSAGGAAGSAYRSALEELLDARGEEIKKRSGEIGDAVEDRFQSLVNINVTRMGETKVALKKAELEATKAAKAVQKEIRGGKDLDDSVSDNQEKLFANVAVYTTLTNAQGRVSDKALDTVEKYAVEYVNSFNDLDVLVKKLKTFDNEDFNMLADELSNSLSSVRGRAGVSQDDEDPYAGMNDPGNPEGEEYSSNEEGGGRTSIVDSLNNNMRKKKLLFEKKKNWGKFRSNRKQKLVVEKDLDAAERRALPDSDFALPGKGEGPEGKQAGAYPINDEEHARLALSMVAQHGTPEEKKKVRAAVARKFPDIKQEEEDEEVRADLQRGPMLDSYQSDTSGYLSEQVTKDKRNKKPEIKNQSFKERYKPKTHWQLQELRRMGL